MRSLLTFSVTLGALPVMPSKPARTAKLTLRLTPEAKRRITAAAQAQERTVSAFVLQSALERAGQALADRSRFLLSAEDWERLVAALDAPPRDLPRLRKLLNTRGPFDRSES
jgi:uncharacterized protein (DUF1778 family)